MFDCQKKPTVLVDSIDITSLIHICWNIMAAFSDLRAANRTIPSKYLSRVKINFLSVVEMQL